MLDPRADEYEIFAASLTNTRKARALLSSYQRHAAAPQSVDALAETLDGLARALQARPVAKKVSLSGRINRMLDAQWWRRNLRRELLRENEVVAHAQGRVRKKQECYASNHAVHRKAVRAKINRQTLSDLEAVNEYGVACNLLEASDASVSNPKVRRAELMVRTRGFEQMAAYMGHEGVFLTITAPSRFHRFSASGKPNPNWNGSTPRQAHDYLCSTWTKIRAKWKRQGINPYGFRVAEPHHDGCPHWHLLLFAPGDVIGRFEVLTDGSIEGGGLLGIAGSYALQDSPNEPGARKHRYTVKRIDPSKGSATGYIAKYISKNIDGLVESGDGMGLDFASGTNASDSCKRVRTWASTWGIRQFQQIGGPSVTVWRELRRVQREGHEKISHSEIFDGPSSAADRSLWALFWFTQGGPETLRADHVIKPLYEQVHSFAYGDCSRRVRGLQGVCAERGCFSLVTRVHSWTVQRAGLAVINTAEDQSRLERSRARATSNFFDAYDELQAKGFFERSGEAASTRTRVNNCTEQTERRTGKSLYQIAPGGGLRIPEG
ncbi:MAG: replication endonuclease [Pseudomonadota bacterium]